MLATRWKKVLRDLWSNRLRTVLVVLSIAIGVFAAGLVSSSYEILTQDMNNNYRRANGHDAVIYCWPFGEELLNAVREIPGVAQAEGRSSIGGQVQMPGGKQVPMSVIAIPDLDEMQIDRIELLNPTSSGHKVQLGSKEIFIEQTSLTLLPVKPGDVISVRFGEKRIRQLVVAGIVHDVSAFSSVFTGSTQAYVSPEAMEWLGGSQQYDQMIITASEKRTDEAHVRAIAASAVQKIEKSGREVFATVVSEPGQHPISSTVRALMMLLGVLGGLAVFLSSFLVINTINALLSQHTRQIGMMKAIGANTPQIMGMYCVLVMGFGSLALMIGVTLSSLSAYLLVSMLSGVLNFTPSPFHIPLSAFLIQVVVALIIPLAAAFLPVWVSARQTIREAISNYGLGRGTFSKSRVDEWMEKVRGLPRPLLISLRNTFRRKARLALTLSTLSLAGAIFIAVFNIQASFGVTIDETLGYFLSDVNLDLNKMVNVQQIQDIAADIPEIKTIEAWNIRNGKFVFDEGANAMEVLLWAPPSGSRLIRPVLTSGRWLLPEDENAIVIGNHVIKLRPDLKVGDMLTLKIGQKESQWRVVGIYSLAGNVIPPFVFVNRDYLNRLLNEVGEAFSFRIVTTSQDAATEDHVVQELERRLKALGITASMTTGAQNQKQQSQQIDILIYFLLAMAILIALVGGLGLMGTMSMNVLDRMREIGIMRSIGARDAAIFSLIVVEGMCIGLISWALGTLLAFPLSRLISDGVGVAFLGTPLKFVFSLKGFILWAILVVILSAAASFLPARNAVRLTIRDVLAYE